jgi:hypothetical protein
MKQWEMRPRKPVWPWEGLYLYWSRKNGEVVRVWWAGTGEKLCVWVLGMWWRIKEQK